MRALYLLLILFGLSHTIYAQKFIWGGAMATGGSANTRSVVSDDSGNIYVSGYYGGQCDFDPSSATHIINSNTTDGYVAKLDSNYALKFVIPLSSTGSGARSTIGDIVLDDTGNIYVNGSFQGNCDFDPTSGTHTIQSKGDSDGFIAKYDSQGKLKWVRVFEGTGRVSPITFTHDNQHNLYLGGWFYNDLDMDPGPKKNTVNNVGKTNMFLVKLDASGQYKWGKHFKGTGYNLFKQIHIGRDDNLYLTGGFTDSLTIDTTTYVSLGSYDTYLVQLNTKGKLTRIKTYHQPRSVRGISVCTGAHGDVYLTGEFDNLLSITIDSTPTTLKGGGYDNMFIIKFDSNWDARWAQSFGAAGYTEPARMIADTADNIYITGIFTSPAMDFDPGKNVVNHKISLNSRDVFLLSLDKNARYNWSRSIGGTNNDYPYGLHLTKNLGLITTGSFKHLIDINPESTSQLLSSPNQWAGYILSLDKCDYENQTYQTHVCDSLVSPSGRYVWDKAGTVYDTTISNLGCTYYHTFNLTYGESSLTEIDTTVCHGYRSEAGKYYFNNGHYEELYTNQSGCDSIVSIDLEIFYNTRGEDSLTGCTNYISPSGRHIWRTSGWYRDTFPNNRGCDSFLLAYVTITKPEIEFDTAVCGLYVSPSTKHSWQTSGVYYDTVAQGGSCDQIYRINLTVHNTEEQNITLSGCNSVSSPSGKYKWFRSGQYVDTLTNRFGCDSVLRCDVRLTKSYDTLVIDECKSLWSPSGKYLWSSDGVYNDTLTNQAGCDSILTITVELDASASNVFQQGEVLICDKPNRQYQWYSCLNEFKALADETNRSFIATENGKYAVVVSTRYCSDTSECLVVDNLGLFGAWENAGLNLYPNPNSGSFVLEHSNTAIQHIHIFDSKGKEVYTLQPENNVTAIHLDLAPGIYHVKAISGRITYTTRFALYND